MKTNREIKELLEKHHGDKARFARFLSIEWYSLNYQLKSDKPKHSLYGQYVQFLIMQKEGKFDKNRIHKVFKSNKTLMKGDIVCKDDIGKELPIDIVIKEEERYESK